MGNEKKQVIIEVRDKIARLADETLKLVCGNSDYEVIFDFDGDWGVDTEKTAYFVYNYDTVPVIFKGNKVDGVAIHMASLLSIGVSEGDIKTTTPAEIPMLECITDRVDKCINIPESLYNQLMVHINVLYDKSGKAVRTMSVIDADRVAAYEEPGEYYFSENNWKTFIGDEASGKYGFNRAYVERSKNRGAYGMYALSENTDPIYNAWYSKEEWATRFATEHPDEDFREPYDYEYPLLDSIVQRNQDGHIFVPKTPTLPNHAVAFDFVQALMNRLDDMENDYYAGTEGLAYELSEDGTYYICTGLGDVPESSDIELASYIDGIQVEAVSARAFAGKTLGSVTIPRTIKSFGAGAFPSNSGAIESVKIRDIAKWTQIAFGGWAASPVNAAYPKVYINGRYRTDLVIPEGVTGIQPRAFGHFRQFTSVKFPSTLTYIADYAFQDCSGIAELTIPASVTNIDQAAFQRCTGVKSIKFEGTPSSISTIAFIKCTQAMDIYVPWSKDEVSNAPWGASNATIHYQFGGTEGLVYTLADDGTYYTCSGIGTATDTDIVIASVIDGIPVTEIGYSAFYGDNITSVVIPNSVIKSNMYAFRQCSSLTNVVISSSLTNIASSMFERCSNLNNLTFAEDSKLKTIEAFAFRYCYDLETITIPERVTRIAAAAFSDCNSLTTVVFKGTVKEISHSSSPAFTNCYLLTDIYVPWSEGAVSGAPWGAANAKIHYNSEV